MNAIAEQVLIQKIRTLPADKLAEANDFIDFLVNKINKTKALNLLLNRGQMAMPATTEAAYENQLMSEVKSVRQARKAQ